MTELVERDSALGSLMQRLQAAGSRGHIVLVGGEAGIGKTSLLRALADTQGATWWGACDALQTPHPLGPLMDIARETEARFTACLAGPRPALFEAVLDDLRLAAAPILVVIEDAHWADDATLDLLRFLGRRIERTHALLAISFRDDEVGSSHPLRRVIGDLPPAAMTRVDLPRLSPQAVETLARRAARPAAGVHAATLGNPFFVTELLREGGASVPRTVQDLVLARFARQSAAAQELLRLVAVVPGRIERWLVDLLLAPAIADLDACLGSGLLLADGTTLSYRHELARVAVESSLSVPVRQALHARVLAALAVEGRDTAPARLVHHAVQAQDGAAVSRYAPLAAEQARERSAHREAAAQWRSALHQGVPPDEAERRRWLEACAVECGLTDLSLEALEARRTLAGMALQRGDLQDEAVQLSFQSAMLARQLRHAEADAANRRAIALLEPLPPALAHVRVWATQASLLMLNRDCDESVAWARRAIALAESLGRPELAVGTRSMLGTALLFIDYDAGCAEMECALELQRADGQHHGAALTLLNLGSGSGELMRLPQAERHLRDAVALAGAHEFDDITWYGNAWLALCALAAGRWDEAAALASGVLARPDTSGNSRVMALVALARLRVRRGDPGAATALDEALALAERSPTLQRIAPVRAARAEAAAARDDGAAVAAEVAQALPLALAHRHPWLAGELAYWGWRAGAVEHAPQVCAEPYALEMAGRWREAALAWQGLGCPYERARSLAAGDMAAQREALELFERLGARPAAEAVRRRLRDAGVRGVARGARPSTREHPFGLTTRELEVLQLLCAGLRNPEIAGRLHRSVRTVDHHVAAVFAKLGVANRVAAIAQAQRAGIAQFGQAAPPK